MSLKSQDDIPLADADDQAIYEEENTNNMRTGSYCIYRRLTIFFIQSSSNDLLQDNPWIQFQVRTAVLMVKVILFFVVPNLRGHIILSPSFILYQTDLQDNTPDEQEEKARLITQVLELQNTLDGKITFSYLSMKLFNEPFFSKIFLNEWTVSKKRI